MRKEVLFAIIAGVTFGAILAYGIWRTNTALKPKETSHLSPTPKEVVTDKEELDILRITLVRPEEKDVITKTPTKISGITRKEVWIAISAEENDYIFKSRQDGSFEQEVELIGGLNQILIKAFDEDGASVEEKINLVFSTEFLEEEREETQPESNEATEEPDIVREKVQEKVEEARKNPKAYLGTVTDIVEETIQIKSDEGEIQQVSVDEEKTEFVNIGKTKKTIKYSELAIGDFIIAMGYRDTNEVLNARRVLLTDAYEPINRKVIYGEILEIAKKEITLKQPDGNQWTAKFGVKWVGPELDELEIGGNVIIVGTTEDAKVSVRTLFIIPIISEESASPTPEEKTE